MAITNKTSGSGSERKVLEHAHRGAQIIIEYEPGLMGDDICS